MLGDLHTPVSTYLKVRDIFPQSALMESSDYHGILHPVCIGYGMLFAAVVRQAEDSRAVVYADTSQRTQSDERTVVLTAVIVGTLHKCALRKDVTHLQIRAHRRMQVTEHGALEKMKFKPTDVVVLTVSGRGDKDIETYLSDE